MCNFDGGFRRGPGDDGAWMMDMRRVTMGICWTLTLGLGLGGCAAIGSRPIFPELDPPIQWPPAPHAARVRYVGSLQTASDLKAQRTALAALGELFVGRKKVESLYGPRAVVVTPDGSRAWIADPGGRCLHLFELQRRVYKKVQQMGDVPLLTPVALCRGPNGSIFVGDSERVAIYRFSDQSGTLVESLRLPEEVLRPVALDYDESADELWVVDAVGHDLKILGADGSLKRIVGRRGTNPGEFNFPCDVALDGDRAWVADAGNHRIQAIKRDGEPLAAFGKAGDSSGDLALPKSVSVDPEGHVYVVDGRFENVQVFDRTGELLLFFGEEGNGPGQFWLPGDIHIEASGRMWVCDSYNRRVQVFQYVQGLNDAR